MAKRPSHTLLLLAADRVARVDLGPAPAFAVLAHRQTGSIAGEDPTPQALAALSLGGPVGSQVWVFWEGLWTQTLEMPSAAVAGLPAEQVARTLAFEAETLSGIPGAQSAVDVVPLGIDDQGRQQFWLSQIARS